MVDNLCIFFPLFAGHVLHRYVSLLCAERLAETLAEEVWATATDGKGRNISPLQNCKIGKGPKQIWQTLFMTFLEIGSTRRLETHALGQDPVSAAVYAFGDCASWVAAC